jgi:hypothetical protein
MTVFDGEPRCHIDTCFWYPNKNVDFGILNAGHFQYDAFLRERVGVRLKIITSVSASNPMYWFGSNDSPPPVPSEMMIYN